jgi:two-component system cell cycle response regulator DivK
MVSVLVIEDNPMNMKLAVHVLTDAGYTVLCANDAETGSMLAKANLPDLILMDFQLPGMDGMTATALLKADPATADIPVIALTALAMSSEQERSCLAQCDAYLAKPWRYQDLYATIDAVLAKSKLSRIAGNNLPTLHSIATGQEVLLETHSSPASALAVDLAIDLAVDLEVLARLVGNDPRVIREFLQSFQLGAAPIALALRAACSQHQLHEVGRESHKLRSSAQMLGARKLGELCTDMEAAARAGDHQSVAALLPMFEKEIAEVSAFIDSWQYPLRTVDAITTTTTTTPANAHNNVADS